MTDAEKAAAFDLLAEALTHRWPDATWTWWCMTPCGGHTRHQTRSEAVADLMAWAVNIVKFKLKKYGADYCTRAGDAASGDGLHAECGAAGAGTPGPPGVPVHPGSGESSGVGGESQSPVGV